MSNQNFKEIGDPETRVIEECSELIQAICKVQRFGWFNNHPDRPSSSNMDEVLAEMDDVVESIERLQEKMREIQAEHYKDYISTRGTP